MRLWTRAALKALENVLLAGAALLALWVGLVLLDARFVADLPVPPAPASDGRSELPGEPPAAADASRTARRAAAAGSWVGRLEAPSVQLAVTILEGSAGRTLLRGAGHIEYTPLPGQPGNVGIAGHRDTAFRPLRHLKPGDRLVLTTSDRVFEYLVSDTWIVKPEDVHVLAPTDRPALTLVTCYPFNFIGRAPRRYIVRAELVEEKTRAPS